MSARGDLKFIISEVQGVLEALEGPEGQTPAVQSYVFGALIGTMGMLEGFGQEWVEGWDR